MFIDQCEISVQSGNGGDGAVSFRREKYIPNGGPDGGDGGNGGDVVIVGKRDLHTLSDFRSKKMYEAQNGQGGMGKKMHGKNGEDCIIHVPLGTIISVVDEASRPVIPDLIRNPDIKDIESRLHVNDAPKKYEILTEGQTEIIAKGGRGGWGNAHFATSIKQAPHWAKTGMLGQQFNLDLELQLIADVGLVGLPNAGKSTFLSVTTNARPKIANYPFTTLEPNLGVADIDGNHLVIADIPGIIEGAASGKGLGVEFLRHINRTKLLLFILDGTDADVKANLKTLENEAKQFNSTLLKKPRIVAINKIDAIPEKDQKKLAKEMPNAMFISCATGLGLTELKRQIIKAIKI
ncbi:MAG: GTPase ObgE [Patescibacteria group bacterium]|jgi:GTP-binding protein